MAKKISTIGIVFLVVLIPNIVEAQPGRVSSEPTMSARDPDTGFVVATLGDSTNNALRVNCVVGCGGGGGAGTDINLIEYLGVAFSATNGMHVRPGTGAVWDIGASLRVINTDIAAASTGLVTGSANYFFNNGPGLWQRWRGFPTSADLPGGEGIPAVSPYLFVDDTATDSITEGSVGLQRMSPNRNAHVEIRDSEGNERGAAVNASNELLVNAAINNFPATQTVSISQVTTSNDVDVLNDAVGEAIAVRCVSIDGSAFEACGGAGGGGGGTSQADNSAITTITGIGALYDTTPPAITDGNVGLPRMSTDRYLYTIFPAGVPQTVAVDGTVIVDAEGSNVVVNDSTLTPIDGATANPVGTERGLIVRNIPSGTQAVSGTVAVSNFPATQPVSGTVTINAIPAGANNIGDVDVLSVIPGVGATNLGKAEDTARVSGDTGVAVLMVRTDGSVTGAAAQVTSAAGDYGFTNVDAYGAQYTRGHPNQFRCTMTSTATTSTVITGCTSPGAGLRRYITDISYNSSIISTTANFMTIQYGTGSNCATGVTVIYRQANSVAFLPVSEHWVTPLDTGVATDLCFLHPGAGTRLINITGFVAP